MVDSSKAPTKRQLKKIVKTQESLLKKEPDNVVARVKLAGALKDLGRIPEALEHYHRVALWYRNAGRRVQALAVCRSVLEFVPEDTDSLSMIAELDDSTHQEAGVAPAEDAPDAPAPGAGGASSDRPVQPGAGPAVQEASGLSKRAGQSRPGGTAGTGDRVSLQPAPLARRASSNSISVVTDFGGSKPVRKSDSERRAGATGASGGRGAGRTIGRIPIVKRPVVRKRRPAQETIQDIEPPKPEPRRAASPAQEEMATPSRPVPESVIRRTLPPEGIEAAARRALGEEDFSEDVPTVEREVNSASPSGESGEAGRTTEDDVISSSPFGENGEAIATTERNIVTAGSDVAGVAGPGSNAMTREDVDGAAEEDRMVGVGGNLDGLATEDSVVVVDEGSAGEALSAQVGTGAVAAPPPLPRDEPLIPDSFGLGADEMPEVGPLPPDGEDVGRRFQTQALGSLLGHRPQRRTSPSLLDIREVLQAKTEEEIEVLSQEEESVFAEMADERRRKGAADAMGQGEESPEGSWRKTGSAAQTEEDGSRWAQTEEVELEDVALFRDLPDDVMAELRSRVVLRDLEPGEYVVREGDPGNALFVLLAGRAAVEKAQEDKVSVLTELGPGSFFGEFALLSDRKRHASVRALSPIRVVEISRKVIGRLAKSHKEVARVLRGFYRRRLLDTLIAATPFFNNLDEKERAAIVPRLRFKRLSPGDAIIEEGSETGGFYLVLVGRVLVTKKTGAGDVQTLAELGEGEYFGEMSLLKGRPAMASVVAAAPTELVEVAAKDFYRVVGDHPEIWQDVDKEARRRELANHAILSGRSRLGDPGIV